MTPPKGKSPLNWYIESGGLRRRLRLLGRIAHNFSVLHSKGLAYSDPSPANIFVSEKTGAEEAWLIDADNLQYESSPGKSVYTVRYAAPELLAKKSGATTLSDAFALAIVAFETLTLAHPFIGDMVHDGPPELEEEAFLGKLPWIFDTNDDRNRSSRGIPRELVISNLLFKSFEKMFGVGRDKPCERPGMSRWAERLLSAADLTLICPRCRGTYYYRSPTCPWGCNSTIPDFLVNRLLLWDNQKGNVYKNNENKAHVVAVATSSKEETLFIDKRLAFGLNDCSLLEPVLSVLLEGDAIRIKSLDGNEYRLCRNGVQRGVISNKDLLLPVEKAKKYMIHFGPENTCHRVLHISLG